MTPRVLLLLTFATFAPATAGQDETTTVTSVRQQVRTGPAGSEARTEITAVPQGAPTAGAVTSRITVGSNVNIANGTHALACTRIGDRMTCVRSQGGDARAARQAEALSSELDRCLAAGSLAAIVACTRARAEAAAR